MVHYGTVAPDTWAVIAGRGVHAPGSPLNVPPVLASNFLLGGDRAYARDDGTPTCEAFEEVLGGLEHGIAVAFASGMATAAAIFDLLPAGADVVLPNDCYQAVVGLAAAGQDVGRWSLSRLGVDDTQGWRRAAERADLLWLESPSNPLLNVADLPAILSQPRKPGAIAVVDNTFATPLGQQPLELGADVVMHSATKYVGGHSDLLLGAAVAKDHELARRLRERRLLAGAIPGALESYLAVRGMRTLHLRFERATATAHELTVRLERHPEVSVVRYPGLPTHPTHSTARRFMRSYGAMISFDVRGDAARADAICARNMSRRFRQVDVFGEDSCTGNPVAVVLDAESLDDDALRRFAVWSNLSECTFVLPPTTPGADYRVRIFSLNTELPFAGHPTLGTARAWLDAGGSPATPGVVVQECGAGLIPVRIDGDLLAFAAPPRIRSGPVDADTLTAVTAILGVEREKVVDAEWLDNGPGWVGVLLDSAQTVLELRPDASAHPGRWDIGVIGPHSLEAETRFELRAFFTEGGEPLREDPVTGSLNAAAAQWLLSSGRASAPYVAAQGTAMGRRGRIHITLPRATESGSLDGPMSSSPALPPCSAPPGSPERRRASSLPPPRLATLRGLCGSPRPPCSPRPAILRRRPS